MSVGTSWCHQHSWYEWRPWRGQIVNGHNVFVLKSEDSCVGCDDLSELGTPIVLVSTSVEHAIRASGATILVSFFPSVLCRLVFLGLVGIGVLGKLRAQAAPEKIDESTVVALGRCGPHVVPQRCCPVCLDDAQAVEQHGSFLQRVSRCHLRWPPQHLSIALVMCLCRCTRALCVLSNGLFVVWPIGFVVGTFATVAAGMARRDNSRCSPSKDNLILGWYVGSLIWVCCEKTVARSPQRRVWRRVNFFTLAWFICFGHAIFGWFRTQRGYLVLVTFSLMCLHGFAITRVRCQSKLRASTLDARSKKSSRWDFIDVLLQCRLRWCGADDADKRPVAQGTAKSGRDDVKGDLDYSQSHRSTTWVAVISFACPPSLRINTEVF